MSIVSNLKPYLIPGSTAEARMSRIVLVFIFFSSLAGLWPAFLNRVLFDRAVPNRNLKLLLPVVLAIVSSELAGMYCRYQADCHLAAMSCKRRLIERNRQSTLIWNRSYNWFSRNGAGTVLRLYEDAAIIGNLHSSFLRQVIGPGITLLLLIVPMFLISPLLASVRLFLVLPALLPGRRYLKDDLSMEKLLWSESRYLSTLNSQMVRGCIDLKISNRIDNFISSLRYRFHSLGEIEKRRKIIGIGWEIWSSGISRIGMVLSPSLAVFLLISGELTFGSFIAFSILAARCISSIGEIFGGFRILARAGNAIDRRKLLEEGESPRYLSYLGIGKPVAFRSRAGLLVRNLHFSYSAPVGKSPGENLIDGATFTIRKGEWVRLNGVNGSGKSTLLNLILGFLRPGRGHIMWSGVSLTECPVSLRSSLVGGIPQFPTFFSGSLRDNLSLFKPLPSDRKIWEALEISGADCIVQGFPDGLDHRLGGGETTLSGGERQRLAITRLLLRRTPLVLLDEPFHALDSDAANTVADALERSFSQSTVVLVHHGETQLKKAYRTLDLSGGVIK